VALAARDHWRRESRGGPLPPEIIEGEHTQCVTQPSRPSPLAPFWTRARRAGRRKVNFKPRAGRAAAPASPSASSTTLQQRLLPQPGLLTAAGLLSERGYHRQAGFSSSSRALTPTAIPRVPPIQLRLSRLLAPAPAPAPPTPPDIQALLRVELRPTHYGANTYNPKGRYHDRPAFGATMRSVTAGPLR